MVDLHLQFQAWFESQVLQGAEAKEEDGPEEDEPNEMVPVMAGCVCQAGGCLHELGMVHGPRLHL